MHRALAADDVLRFISKVDRSGGKDACWEWRGARDQDGYGFFTVDGRNLRAHRVAYELSNDKPVPAGVMACHRCDRPCCVNPRHLFLGTAADNMRDKVAKGREARGERNGRAKLTDAQVRGIRAMHARGGISYTAVGRAHGVTRTAVRRIVQGLLRRAA